MPTISCDGHNIPVQEQEYLLNALERAGIAIPNSCRAGLCHCCLVELKNGNVSRNAQLGLTENQKRLNYVLSCLCRPENDLEIGLLDNNQRHPATLIEKHFINHGVMIARFKANIDWLPGQYLTLWRNETVGRVYSIASLPEEGYVELHLRRRLSGVVSSWLEHRVSEGDVVHLSQATGHCYYTPMLPTQPIVIACTGTGLAPALGVLKNALANRHRGDITLYAAAGEPQQLYHLEELLELAARHRNFQFYPVVRRRPNATPALIHGDLIDVVKSRHRRMARHQIFLFGRPEMIETLQEICYLQGANLQYIFADAFDSKGSGLELGQ